MEDSTIKEEVIDLTTIPDAPGTIHVEDIEPFKLSNYGFPSRPGLAEQLESIAKEVNDSIRYDYGTFFQIEMKQNPWNEPAILEWIANAPYKPTGNETRVGRCTDAGKLICERINKINGLHCGHDKMHKERFGLNVTHEIIQVYDDDYKEFLYLNTKSPYIQFNVFPKEQLKEYGIQVSD